MTAATVTYIIEHAVITTLHAFSIIDIGKRSIKEETPFSPDANITITQLDDSIVPEQFKLENYFSLSEVHRQKRPTSDMYTLIILDASGSIGNYFRKMKNVAGMIARYLPCNTKVAVMSYSTYVYGQYCFDCSQNTNNKRDQMRAKIESIPFPGRLTASGDAIACVCDQLLKKKCGFKNTDQVELTVIFMTDGRSNRGKSVCSAARTCWKSISDVVEKLHVVAIPVTLRPIQSEIDCIKGSRGDEIPLQKFQDLQNYADLLKSQAPSGNTCDI